MVLALAPAAVFAAVGVLLLIWATFWVFEKPIATLLGGLPVVGGAVASTVANAVGGLVDWAIGWADNTIVPAIEMVTAPIGAIVGAAEAAASALEGIAANVRQAVNLLWAAVDNAGAAIAALFATVGAINRTLTNVAGLATTLMGIVVWLRDTALPDAVASAIRVATGHASAMTAAEAQTRAQADAAASAAISAEAQTRAAQAAAITAELNTSVLPHLGTLDGELAGLTAVVGTLTAAQLITRLGTLEAEVTTTFRDCVTPQCNIIGPTLGNLAGLADMGMVLALGAFVGEAARDPETVAHDVAGAIGGIHDVASGLLGAFTGIRA